MKCVPCRADMRPFYDEGGRIILGQECRECGRALFTWDAGVAMAPPEGAVRRYEPYDPATEGPLPELPPVVPTQPTKRGKQREPIECACGCGVWFAPGPQQRYASEDCLNTVRRERAQYQSTRLGKHDAPEFSASAQ